MSCESEDREELGRILPPVTEEQLISLQPALNRIAKKYATSEDDRHDYVQQANVALLTRTGWTSPLTLARSVMIDYWRKKASNRDTAELLNWKGDSRDQDRLCLEELRKFEGLGLSDSDRQIATLYFLEELSQSQIAQKLDKPQTTISMALSRVREAVREKWCS